MATTFQPKRQINLFWDHSVLLLSLTAYFEGHSENGKEISLPDNGKEKSQTNGTTTTELNKAHCYVSAL